MASKRPQTMAKRARELAIKEKRERKRLKKAERAAGISDAPTDEGDGTESESETEPADSLEHAPADSLEHAPAS